MSILDQALDMNSRIPAPAVPPADWFYNLPEGWDPLDNPEQPVIWLDFNTGRFAALVAPLDACIQNGTTEPGACESPRLFAVGDDGSYANIGSTLAVDADGSEVRVPTGRIAAELEHANITWDRRRAVDHYSHTGLGVARAHYWIDDRAIWATGSLDPTVTVWQALALQAVALSGDWRWVEELQGLRLIASQAVNNPGFRHAGRAASAARYQDVVYTYQVSARSASVTASTRQAATDRNLRDYWVNGEGAAKIRWGTDGSFNRCVVNLRGKVRDPQGLCAEYHHDATGKWPGQRANTDPNTEENPMGTCNCNTVTAATEGEVDMMAELARRDEHIATLEQRLNDLEMVLAEMVANQSPELESID